MDGQDKPKAGCNLFKLALIVKKKAMSINGQIVVILQKTVFYMMFDKSPTSIKIVIKYSARRLIG
jgi:hypothetical protein